MGFWLALTAEVPWDNPEVIERIRQEASAARTKVVIFDFDGTLSVLRSGWMNVMIPLCVRHLQATDSGESTKELEAVAEDSVWKLTGKETIYQMMALASEVEKRGGIPNLPIEYKGEYLAELHAKIHDRLEALRSRRSSPETYQVPGSRELLSFFAGKGLTMYLASGTDDANVKEEASLLELDSFFGERIFGAQDDLQSFSKALLVKNLVEQSGFAGEELMVFGDGFVEIEEVKKVGGTTVGVATAEPECQTIDSWKRERLIRAGADFIVANYHPISALVDELGIK